MTKTLFMFGGFFLALAGVYLLAGKIAYGKKNVITQITTNWLSRQVGMNQNIIARAIFLFLFLFVLLWVVVFCQQRYFDIFIVTDIIVVAFGYFCLISYFLSKISKATDEENWLWAFFGSIAITCIFAVNKNWFTVNLASIPAIICLLCVFRNIKMKEFAIYSVAVTIFDAISVFGTGQMNQLIEKSTGRLTGNIVLNLSLEFYKGSISIGGGDIVFPGLVLMIAYRNGSPCQWLGAYIGWLVGFAVTFFAAFYFNSPQPATIYLVPLTVGGYYVGCCFRRQK